MSPREENSQNKYVPAPKSEIVSTNAFHQNSLTRFEQPQNPQFYDPTRGFVLFYDFATKIPLGIKTIQIVASIHHYTSGLGIPSALKPAQTEIYRDRTTNQQLSFVPFNIRQPVPGFVRRISYSYSRISLSK